jgi:glycosyltransferase involved in cell wall biosynthesis
MPYDNIGKRIVSGKFGEARVKIACAAGGWYPQSAGGLEKYVYGLVQALSKNADDVTLFVTGTPESWDSHSTVFSLGDPKYRLLRRLLSARACYARNYREPYDVVNMHFAMYQLPLLPYIAKTTPVVFTFHGPWAQESRVEGSGALSVALKHMVEQCVYRRADRFITLSTAFKDIVHHSYGIDRERISVVPMGIDCGFFTPPVHRAAVRRALGWPTDKTVIFTARRLVRRVGVLELVEAAAMLKSAGCAAVVKIAGKGPLMQELKETIDCLALNDVVELLGFVTEEQLVQAYQAADVTVLPTQTLEGFGTIISESLACGTPVVGTPVGGITEALTPLDPRLLARSSSVADIAAVLRSICSGELHLPNSATCRAYAVANYEWDHVSAQIRTIFEQARSERLTSLSGS